MPTKRQKQILDFLTSFQKKKGFAPSLEEIKKHLKLSSVSTIHFHIKKLQDEGFLNKGENSPRSISVFESQQMVKVPLMGTIAAGQPIEAIQVKETAADILNYRLDLYKEAEPGDVSPGGGPTLEEVRTHTPSDQGGGGSGPGSFDIGQILNLLGSLFGGGGSGESDNPVTEPSFDYSLLPLSQVNAGQPNTAQLAWSIPGATNCRATNNWFSGNSTDAPTLIYAKGSVVPSESERTISLPLNFKPRFIRTRNNVDNSIEIATSVNSSKTSTLNKLPLPADIQIGDKYTVSFWPYVGSTNLVEFTVTENLTQSQLGQKLLEKINLARNSSTNPAYPVFSSYYFALNGLAIDASLSPNYSLECTSPGGNITKSITLAR